MSARRGTGAVADPGHRRPGTSRCPGGQAPLAHTCPGPSLAFQSNRSRAALSSSASTPSAPFMGLARDSSRSRNARVPGKDRLSASAPASASGPTSAGGCPASCKRAARAGTHPGARHPPQAWCSADAARGASPDIPHHSPGDASPNRPTNQPSLNSLAGSPTLDDLKRPRGRGGHGCGVRVSGPPPSTAGSAPGVGWPCRRDQRHPPGRRGRAAIRVSAAGPVTPFVAENCSHATPIDPM